MKEEKEEEREREKAQPAKLAGKRRQPARVGKRGEGGSREVSLLPPELSWRSDFKI